jgi:peptidoglycan/xylan/chitin deacetylase (PgdA/CDA1 family)
VRSFVFTLFRITGLIFLLRRINRDSVAILMLHGVMDEEVPSEWVPLRPQLSRKHFRLILRILSGYYRFIGMEEAAGMVSGRVPFKPNRMVLTFDDGYRNQLKHTLPILREFNAPATIFLATGHIESRKPFWFDRLDYAIQHARLAGRRLQAGNEIVQFPSQDRDGLRAAFKRLRDSAKKARRPDALMAQEMESLAESLEQESGRRLADICEQDDWSALLNWPEIRTAAAQEAITFGSHTVDHTRLGLAEEGEIRRQLALSKESIERRTGKECRYFCFPSGSFSPLSLSVLKEFGYEAAVTTREGLNRRGQNLLALNRVSLPASVGRADLLWQTLQLSTLKTALRMSPALGPTTECLLGE